MFLTNSYVGTRHRHDYSIPKKWNCLTVAHELYRTAGGKVFINLYRKKCVQKTRISK